MSVDKKCEDIIADILETTNPDHYLDSKAVYTFPATEMAGIETRTDTTSGSWVTFNAALKRHPTCKHTLGERCSRRGTPLARFVESVGGRGYHELQEISAALAAAAPTVRSLQPGQR